MFDRASNISLDEPIIAGRTFSLINQAELIEFFLFCMSMCHECVLNSKTIDGGKVN
jgi:hypothetical protein